MIGFYDYTVILTYLGLASGVTGIFNAIKGNPTVAICCLMLSGFLDMFDGLVARTKKNRTKNEKNFGIQLDSLSDLVCFGVLPTVIGYSIGLTEYYYIPIFVVFVLAALIRLAYFNVTEEERQAMSKEERKEYEGLPVTSVAILIPLIYSFKHYINFDFSIVYAISLVLIAMAFVTKFKLKKLKRDGMILAVIIGIIELVILILQKVR